MTSDRIKVLFVCMGNICRSPTAEGVCRALVQQEASELELEIDSAGTHAYHTGEPPDARAQLAAQRRGYELTGAARFVEDEDFESFDYILAMDERNYRDLMARCPVPNQSRLRLFMQYSSKPMMLSVPDPYYGGTNGFEQVLDLVEDASRGLLKELRRAARRRAAG